jgi:hypothetical protein
LCNLSHEPSNQRHLSPRHLQVCEPLTQLSSVDNTVNAVLVMKVNRLHPDPTTANIGRGLPPTANQMISSS